MSGITRIAAERIRQIELGYDEEHDARHIHGALARAAACYALSSTNEGEASRSGVPAGWPWGWTEWKPGDRIHDLEKAGALIAAEIDRLTGELS